MARLIIRSDAGEQIFHDLADETVAVGRSLGNAIRLDDISVSGRHAELIVLGESCYLKDLDSTNGTLVNGEPVSGVPLRAGDRIRFGKVGACFECDIVGAARPADFANASPFPDRKKEKDPIRLAILGVAAVAFLAFLASMIALFMMHAPTP